MHPTGSAAAHDSRSTWGSHNYLIQQGVPAGATSAAGFGKTRPVASNGTPEGRQLNRRVELVVSETRSGRRTTKVGRSRGGPSGPPRPKFKSRKPRAQGLGSLVPSWWRERRAETLHQRPEVNKLVLRVVRCCDL
jgi:hypothetical protein